MEIGATGIFLGKRQTEIVKTNDCHHGICPGEVQPKDLNVGSFSGFFFPPSTSVRLIYSIWAGGKLGDGVKLMASCQNLLSFFIKRKINFNLLF